MKRLSALALALLAPAAFANITPSGGLPTGVGPFIFSYDATLASDANALVGAAPTSNPVANTTPGIGAFFTIYDFAGYITGSCTGPSGWSCTVQMLGYTPTNVAPVDSGLLPNITWTHTSGADIIGSPNGVELGRFSASSIYGQTTQISYTSRTVKNSGLQAGTTAANVGFISGPRAPDAVPEPGSVGLAGLALGLLAWTSRAKKPAQQT